MGLVPGLIIQGVTLLVAKFTPAGALSWIKTLYDIIMFFVDNGRKIGTLFETIKEGFLDLVNGGQNLAKKLGGKVVETLQSSLPLVFDGLARIFNLGNIPKAFGDVLDKVRQTAQKPLKKILNVVGKYAKTIVDKAMSALGIGSGKEVVVGPVKSGGTTAWVEADEAGNVEVMVAQSPSRKANESDPNVKEIKEESGKIAKALRRITKGESKEAGIREGAQQKTKATKELTELVAIEDSQRGTMTAEEKALLWKVGSYKDLKNHGSSNLRAHHVGQKVVMRAILGKDYDEETGPRIIVPSFGHNRSDPILGIVSRNKNGFNNVADLVQRDIDELKRVYPDVPRASLERLVKLNAKYDKRVNKVII